MPSLDPPDRGALWLNLALTKTQLARLCDVTVRQVTFWTAQGYIQPSGRRAWRRDVTTACYNGNAIDLCLLIKQGLDEGRPLRNAVARARAFLAAEEGRQPGLSRLGPEALLEVGERLQAALAALAGVRDAVRVTVLRDAGVRP